MAKVYPFAVEVISSVLHPKSRVLDVGCGEKLYDSLLPGTYEGVDIAVVNPDNPPDYIGTAAQINCAADRFDCAFGIGTFCVIPHVDDVFTELYRVLKPEGRLLVIDYQYHTGLRLLEAGHYGAWTFDTLKTQLINAGYTNVIDRSAEAYRHPVLRWLYGAAPWALSMLGAKPTWLVVEASLQAGQLTSKNEEPSS